MKWKDDVDYLTFHQFTREQLLPITAEELYKWAKFCIHGNVKADEEVTPTVNYRVNSVLVWKRSISYFMPNYHMPWNDTIGEGNPSRSMLIARLIHHIRQMQMQHHTHPSRVRRAYTQAKFESLIKHFWGM